MTRQATLPDGVAVQDGRLKHNNYILVGGLKVTYSYQVLKNGLEDVTNDVRDCPGGGPCYVLVYVGLEAGLVTQSKDSLFCPQQKWTFHLFLHFESADF